MLIVASLPLAATPIGWAGLAFGGDEVITGILNAANWGTNEIPGGTQMLLRVFVENETAAFWIELVLKAGTGVGVKLLSRKLVPVRGPAPEPGAGGVGGLAGGVGGLAGAFGGLAGAFGGLAGGGIQQLCPHVRPRRPATMSGQGGRGS